MWSQRAHAHHTGDGGEKRRHNLPSLSLPVVPVLGGMGLGEWSWAGAGWRWR